MGKKHKLDGKTYPTDETARVFRRRDRTLQLWHQAGCPRVKPGRWDLRDVVEWWAENIWSAGAGADDSPGSDLQKARTDYWKAKAEQMALSVEKARETLMPKSEVITAWTERVVNVAAALEALADRLPPLLVGKAPREMQPIIKAEVRTLREGFASEGRWCPTPNALSKLLADYHEAESEGKADGK